MQIINGVVLQYITQNIFVKTQKTHSYIMNSSENDKYSTNNKLLTNKIKRKTCRTNTTKYHKIAKATHVMI